MQPSALLVTLFALREWFSRCSNSLNVDSSTPLLILVAIGLASPVPMPEVYTLPLL